MTGSIPTSWSSSFWAGCQPKLTNPAEIRNIPPRIRARSKEGWLGPVDRHAGEMWARKTGPQRSPLTYKNNNARVSERSGGVYARPFHGLTHRIYHTPPGSLASASHGTPRSMFPNQLRPWYSGIKVFPARLGRLPTSWPKPNFWPN